MSVGETAGGPVAVLQGDADAFGTADGVRVEYGIPFALVASGAVKGVGQQHQAGGILHPGRRVVDAVIGHLLQVFAEPLFIRFIE